MAETDDAATALGIDREAFTAFSIGFRESLDRTHMWCDIGQEFLRLGWLCRVMRGPDQLHTHVNHAVGNCLDMAKEEANRTDQFIGYYRKHLELLEKHVKCLEDKKNDLCKIDGDWSE